MGLEHPKGAESCQPRAAPWVQAGMCKSRTGREKALCFSALAPLGRYLLLRHKPRALPWARSYLALQADFTGQQ